jgi:hypothetical protein
MYDWAMTEFQKSNFELKTWMSPENSILCFRYLNLIASYFHRAELDRTMRKTMTTKASSAGTACLSSDSSSENYSVIQNCLVIQICFLVNWDKTSPWFGTPIPQPLLYKHQHSSLHHAYSMRKAWLDNSPLHSQQSADSNTLHQPLH